MSESIQVLVYCREHGLAPRFLFTNPLYASLLGEDWLPKYFEVLGDLKPDENEVALRRDQYVPFSINLRRKFKPATKKLTLNAMHDLFTASLSFKKRFLDESDQFCNQHQIGKNTIGIHYRGTDKRLEAGVVPWEDLGARLQACISANTRNIFVATDEPAFLRWVRDRFKANQVTDLDCREIYSGDRPAHLTLGDPDIKAREAILTILVLSRCGLLIRTRSNLSAWAKVINPDLPLIVLGNMRDFGFPENLMMTDASHLIE